MGEQVTFPLSGDVSQWFNIFSNFNRGGQIGLFNIELGESSDPALERELLGKVGSYGRQIGQLTDMIAVLLNLVPPEALAGLDAQDTRVVERFRTQADLVTLVKKGAAQERAAPSVAGAGTAA